MTGESTNLLHDECNRSIARGLKGPSRYDRAALGEDHEQDPSSTRHRPVIRWILGLFVLAVVLSLLLYRPDRPVDTITPGSSSGPAFVVQIIRPRLSLPLGGILPPQLFGVDSHLGFDHKSRGAAVGDVSENRIELGAESWAVVLVLDAGGKVTSESEVLFELTFEDELRLVRCRPADEGTHAFKTSMLADSTEISGHFDIDLTRCEDAETGESLGWPAETLVLHGSFDRLPLKPR